MLLNVRILGEETDDALMSTKYLQSSGTSGRAKEKALQLKPQYYSEKSGFRSLRKFCLQLQKSGRGEELECSRRKYMGFEEVIYHLTEEREAANDVQDCKVNAKSLLLNMWGLD